MSSLEYSVDALNVKGAFHGAKAMLYVEGDDDVLFWREVVSLVPGSELEIESVDGADELDKYINRIERDGLVALVARDSDFLCITRQAISNPRVMYSYGYSIENSLYTADAVVHLARVWGKSTKVVSGDSNVWLRDFANAVAPLVRLDLANFISNAGVDTIGDNCTKFMTSQISAQACSIRVASHAKVITPQIARKVVKEASEVIGDDPEVVLRFLRGHFLASAVLKYIIHVAKGLGRKINISFDSLYAAAVTYFAQSLAHKHPHRGHYESSVRSALAAL